MKIKFDMKYRREIESGKYKVVTDSGKPVTIERWDMKGNYPILASMMTHVCDYEGENSWEEERAFCFTSEGICLHSLPSKDGYRLFIETIETPTEAERMLFNKINDHVYNHDPIDEEEVHEWMEKNFLPIVRKELKDEPRKV